MSYISECTDNNGRRCVYFSAYKSPYNLRRYTLNEIEEIAISNTGIGEDYISLVRIDIPDEVLYYISNGDDEMPEALIGCPIDLDQLSVYIKDDTDIDGNGVAVPSFSVELYKACYKQSDMNMKPIYL